MTAFTIFIINAILGVICATLSRYYRGAKSGIYYFAKRSNPNKQLTSKVLRKFDSNIHSLSSPAGFINQGVVFFFVLAIFSIDPDFSKWAIIASLASAYLVATGSSTLASMHWQGFINDGNGLPFFDEKEDTKTEFYIGKIRFYYTNPFAKLFSVKRKKWLILVGLIQTLVGGAILANKVMSIIDKIN